VSHLGHCVYFDDLPNARAILLYKPEGKEGIWGIEFRLHSWNWTRVNETSNEDTPWQGTLDEAEQLIQKLNVG
jgi:hypothetical protein